MSIQRRMICGFSLGLLSLVAARTPNVNAQCVLEPPVELQSGNSAGIQRNFGISMGLDGETMVVCSDKKLTPQGNYVRTGEVFRYINGNWEELALLMHDGVAPSDQFGQCAAISGSSVMIGAPYADEPHSDTGAVYLYEATNGEWAETSVLTPSDWDSNDTFGFSLAMDGDRAVIGAPNEAEFGVHLGSAYIFQRINGQWQETAKLIGNGVGGNGGLLGWSTDIRGVTAIAGAPYNAHAGTRSGAAYIFREANGAWQQIASLMASDGRAGSEFGYSVALSNDGQTAVVGARLDEEAGTRDGAAYVFREIDGNWIQIAKLTASDPGYYRQFGGSVAIDGEHILVGTPGDHGHPDRGAAYLFQEVDNSWLEIAKLVSSSTFTDEYFGASTIIQNARVFISSPRDFFTVGAVFSLAFDELGADCNANAVPDACEPPLATLTDFVTALLNASSAPFDICLFDGDNSGTLDGRDVEPFVLKLLAP